MSSADHLGALAAHLHPHRMPQWLWAEKVWVWGPPWADPDDPLEELGADYHEAHVALTRILARHRCPHGVPRPRPCAKCRSAIVASAA